MAPARPQILVGTQACPIGGESGSGIERGDTVMKVNEAMTRDVIIVAPDDTTGRRDDDVPNRCRLPAGGAG